LLHVEDIFTIDDDAEPFDFSFNHQCSDPEIFALFVYINVLMGDPAVFNAKPPFILML